MGTPRSKAKSNRKMTETMYSRSQSPETKASVEREPKNQNDKPFNMEHVTKEQARNFMLWEKHMEAQKKIKTLRRNAAIQNYTDGHLNLRKVMMEEDPFKLTESFNKMVY